MQTFEGGGGVPFVFKVLLVTLRYFQILLGSFRYDTLWKNTLWRNTLSDNTLWEIHFGKIHFEKMLLGKTHFGKIHFY